jgi:hypothetical protein
MYNYINPHSVVHMYRHTVTGIRVVTLLHMCVQIHEEGGRVRHGGKSVTGEAKAGRSQVQGQMRQS